MRILSMPPFFTDRVAPTQVKGVYTSIAMMGFLHVYLKYSQPLFVQAIMAFKSLYEAKIVKIHVLGQAADGDLKRPFKSGPGLFGGPCPSSSPSALSLMMLSV
jgi:Phosphate transport (Pho88)